MQARMLAAFLLLATSGAAAEPILAGTDPAGDVIVWPAAPVVGPGADALDVLGFAIESWTPDGMRISMAVADAGAMDAAQTVDPAYSAQYAVLLVLDGGDRMQVMGVHSGALYQGTTPWRFGGYDHAGEWQELTGSVEGDTFLVDVPAAFLGHPGAGAEVTEFYAQAWGSYALADPQWTDWASTEATATMPGTMAEGPAPSPAPSAAKQESPGLALLPLAAGLLALAALRRR